MYKRASLFFFFVPLVVGREGRSRPADLLPKRKRSEEDPRVVRLLHLRHRRQHRHPLRPAESTMTTPPPAPSSKNTLSLENELWSFFWLNDFVFKCGKAAFEFEDGIKWRGMHKKANKYLWWRRNDTFM